MLTFCADRCNNEKCMRHPAGKHIHQRQSWASFKGSCSSYIQPNGALKKQPINNAIKRP